jgi:hypothetical protein
MIDSESEKSREKSSCSDLSKRYSGESNNRVISDIIATDVSQEINLSIGNVLRGLKAVADLGIGLVELDMLDHLREEVRSLGLLKEELEEEDSQAVLQELENTLFNFLDKANSRSSSEISQEVKPVYGSSDEALIENPSLEWNVSKSNPNHEEISTEKGIAKRIAENVMEIECLLAKAWASLSHKRLFAAQWKLSPTPEWFDHSIDLFFQWSKTNNSLWLERGVFGGLGLQGGNLLELSCGDGFNARHFYSHRSKKVVACDFDPLALRTAKSKNNAPNIEYVLADIRTHMPGGKYENIVWDAAIEHFTPEEIISIMSDLKKRLTEDGVLSGHTLIEKGGGAKHIHQHEYEFKDMKDLKRFLSPHFENVKVFETIFPSRHNLYFWASDSEIPFDTNWSHCI